MANLFGTVDADGHLEENHIDWKARLPDKYKSKAPDRRDSGNGQLRTIIEDKAWPRPADLASASAARTAGPTRAGPA